MAGLSSSFIRPALTPAQNAAKILRDMGLSPVMAITDFLEAIRRTTMESIERTYGTAWVRAAKVEYVLTVPAMWSDSAKNLMVQAVEKAGFGTHCVDFNLISESEALAQYTFKVTQPYNVNVS
jgi:hypothetical protein